MHSGKCVVLGTYSNNLFRHLDSIGILGVKSGYKCIGIPLLHHRHSKVIALIHLVVCLFKSISLTCTFLCQMLGISSSAALLFIGAHIHNLYICKVELQAIGQAIQAVRVTKQDWLADSFLTGLHCRLHHRWVSTFRKYHTLRMQSRSGMQITSELGLLT